MDEQRIIVRNLSLTGWACFLLVLVYLLPEVAVKGPYGMHQWRQCDAYSLAVNYFQEDRSMAEPIMHFVHGSANGEAVGEFTGTYWLNAQLWKAIGFHPWTMRWTHLLLWLAGLVSLYLLGREWIGWKASAWVVSLVMVSPLMTYYGPNYLVNGAGLGLVYVGWWWAYRLNRNGEWKALLIAVAALCLALLFRPTMAIGFAPLGLAFFRTRYKWQWMVLLLLPILVAGTWVAWSQSYNARMQSLYFCTTIRPIWESADPLVTWRTFREMMVPQWYHRFVLWSGVIGVLSGSVLMWRNLELTLQSKRAYLGISALILVFALLAYFLLWFSNLDVHDYYLIEFQLAVPVVLAWLFYKPEQWLLHTRTRWALLTVALPFLLLFQSVESSLRTRMKHAELHGWLSELFIPAREREVWNWFHWDYERRLGSISGLKEHLRSLGIERQDRVMSVPDPSSNITLSLMDVKGFTDLYDDAFSGDERIAHYVARGATVLVCNDDDWWENHAGSPWLTAPLSGYQSFRLFDLVASEAFVDSLLISKP